MCKICRMEFCPSGCPGNTDAPPRCPICGAEFPEALYSRDGEVIACDSCVEVELF